MLWQRLRALGVIAVTASAGCGDNSRVCGTGTREQDGVCVPESTTFCGDGTRLEGGRCVVDPGACEAGTVLVADRCVDPASDLVIDLEEGPEPNGLGVAAGVEPSPRPAGAITLAGNTPFVVHGRITPFRDDNADDQLDPDVDTYLLSVTAPVLLRITVDGVDGAQGAFYLTGAPDGAFPGYERYGLNLTGDTADRHLVLPAAGQYRLAITDTRALSIGGNRPPPAGAGGAAGSSDAEYYATITALPLPAPTALAVSGGVATQSGVLAANEVVLVTAGVTGAITARAAMPRAATASVIVLRTGQPAGYADENPGLFGAPVRTAEVVTAAGDGLIVAVDAVYNYGPAPEAYTLTITQN